MKKFILLSLLTICAIFSLRAQTEIKINPVALLFTGIGVGVEYGINNEFGVDLNALIVEGGGGVWVTGKYYLNPRQGLDRFHIGIFAGAITDVAPGLGFMIGQKIVSSSNKVLLLHNKQNQLQQIKPRSNQKEVRMKETLMTLIEHLKQ